MSYIKRNKLRLLSFSLVFVFAVLNIIIIKQTLIISTSNQAILSKLSNASQVKSNNSAPLKSSAIPQGSTSRVKLNGFSANILSEQPINQMLKSDLIALIQNTIQDELHDLKYIADSKSNAYFSDNNKSDSNKTSSLLNATINSNYDVEFDDDTSVIAESEMTTVIEGAIGQGVWSIEDNEQLTKASLRLKPEAKRRLREKLMTAINNQEVTMTKDVLIIF